MENFVHWSLLGQCWGWGWETRREGLSQKTGFHQIAPPPPTLPQAGGGGQGRSGPLEEQSPVWCLPPIGCYPQSGWLWGSWALVQPSVGGGWPKGTANTQSSCRSSSLGGALDVSTLSFLPGEPLGWGTSTWRAWAPPQEKNKRKDRRNPNPHLESPAPKAGAQEP